MTVTAAVVLLAAVTGIVVFVLSAVRALDPVDPVGTEQAVTRRLIRLRRFLRERLDRRTAGGLMLTLALIVTFTVAVLVGLMLDMVDNASGLASLDADVAAWGIANADTTAVVVLQRLTHLGDTLVVVPALVIAAAIDFGRHRRVEVFVFLAAVIVGEKLIVNGLKALVDRERPDTLQLASWAGPSFPSGHAAAAAAVWPAIALVLGRGCSRLIRALLAACAAFVAVAVAASRALLGVHWLTDVIAGLAIGYGWFLICAVMFGGRAQRLGHPLAIAPEAPNPRATRPSQRLKPPGAKPQGATPSRPGTDLSGRSSPTRHDE